MLSRPTFVFWEHNGRRIRFGPMTSLQALHATYRALSFARMLTQKYAGDSFEDGGVEVNWELIQSIDPYYKEMKDARPLIGKSSRGKARRHRQIVDQH